MTIDEELLDDIRSYNFIQELRGNKSLVDERLADSDIVDEMNRKNPRGDHRPTIEVPEHLREAVGHRHAPMPYVSGPQIQLDQWARTDSKRAKEIEKNKLCLVCGFKRGRDWIYGLVAGESKDKGPASPTFGHKHCIHLASLYCPHLKNQEFPAALQDGTKITHAQLKELADAERKAKHSERQTHQ